MIFLVLLLSEVLARILRIISREEEDPEEDTEETVFSESEPIEDEDANWDPSTTEVLMALKKITNTSGSKGLLLDILIFWLDCFLQED